MMAKSPLIDLRQVFSLTDFLRHHCQQIDRLTASGKPSVLTVNGDPALIIQDPESYQGLLDSLNAYEAERWGGSRMKAVKIEAALSNQDPSPFAESAFRLPCLESSRNRTTSSAGPRSPFVNVSQATQCTLRIDVTRDQVGKCCGHSLPKQQHSGFYWACDQRMAPILPNEKAAYSLPLSLPIDAFGSLRMANSRILKYSLTHALFLHLK